MTSLWETKFLFLTISGWYSSSRAGDTGNIIDLHHHWLPQLQAYYVSTIHDFLEQAKIKEFKIIVFSDVGSKSKYVFIPLHKKVVGYYVIPSEPVWVSVRPSVSASFPDSNLNSFLPIFFKLCKDVDIGEELFGVANGLHAFINNRVMALDWCKNVYFLNVFWTNEWILIKLCICIDRYIRSMLYLAHVIFSQFLTELWPLINVRILFMLNIFWINLWIQSNYQIFYMDWYWQDVDLDDWTTVFDHFQQNYGPWLMSKFRLCSISCGPVMDFDKIVYMHWYWQNVGKDNYKLFFVIFQLSYGPWLISKFHFLLISWEQIDGFWWSFVYAVLWQKDMKFFRTFQQSYDPWLI